MPAQVLLFIAFTFILPTDALGLSNSLRTLYKKPQSVHYPSNNPYSIEKARLGKKLFFDPMLSRNKNMACATCHNPKEGWTDGRARAIGHEGAVLGRRTPTLLNVAFGWSFFWDGRAQTLEEHSLGPIQNPQEMGMPIAELVLRLKTVSRYVSLFSEAFPGEEISSQNIAKAIATFERQIISNPSPFDRWVEGQNSNFSMSAQKGFEIFNNKAKCAQCHSGWNLTNGSFSDTGVSETDIGRGAIDPRPILEFAFKTPSLRDIASRGPYMHNGIFRTLSDVIEHYNRGGTHIRRQTRRFIQPLHLSEEEKRDLLEFLLSLTEESP